MIRHPPTLGLDIATACGWALAEADRVSRSGAINLSLRPGDHPGMRYLRLARFLQAGPWPAGLRLALEDVRSHTRRDRATGKAFVATTAAHVYGGLRAIAEAWAASEGVPVLPVGVGAWKSGLGLAGSHATKDEVMARVRLLGYAPATQDEADAIGVALWAWRQAAPAPATKPLRRRRAA